MYKEHGRLIRAAEKTTAGVDRFTQSVGPSIPIHLATPSEPQELESKKLHFPAFLAASARRQVQLQSMDAAVGAEESQPRQGPLSTALGYFS